MKLIKAIPNTITSFNLFFGCLSILFVMKGEPVLAGWMIFCAAICDFFDGFSASLLNAKSKMGVELDSLADVVSFGVAPGFILYSLMELSHGRRSYIVFEQLDLFLLLAFLLPIFAALRLAKFNVDTRQTTSFIGLPTPAMAIFVASLPMIRQYLYESQSFTYQVFTNNYFYIAIAVTFSLLMVSNIPFFSFKSLSFKWKGNEFRWIFIAIAFVLLIWLQVLAVPFIMLAYFLISLVIMLVN